MHHLLSLSLAKHPTRLDDLLFSSAAQLYIHGQAASKHHQLQLHKQSVANTNQSSPVSSETEERKCKLLQVTMICAKRTAQLAKKCQTMAALGRKRLTWGVAKEADECCASVAVKGHCVMYTSDGKRFEVPLAYLSTLVFSELLRMSQEEFGFMGNERITLPCDAAVMEYAMCLLTGGSSAEVEKAFLSTMAVSCHYASCIAPYVGVSHQVVV